MSEPTLAERIERLEAELRRDPSALNDWISRMEQEPNAFAYPLLHVVITHALVHLSPTAQAFLRNRVRDPRVVDLVLRRRIISRLEQSAHADDLRAIADALSVPTLESRTDEMSALARLLVQGCSAWDSPLEGFAITYLFPREVRLGQQWNTLARRAGRTETLLTSHGEIVVRAWMDAIPRMDETEQPSHPCWRLLRALHERHDAFVWIAGLALPTQLDWHDWVVFFGPLLRASRFQR